MMKENIKELLLDIGIAIVLFIFLNIFISSTLFIFKIQISKAYSIVSLILSILFIIIKDLLMKKCKWNTVIKVLLTMIIIFGSILIASKTYDTSWDGNSYHKAAIGQLKNGWNPNYEKIEDFNVSKSNKIKLESVHQIWNNHYAKGHWIFAANIYSLTNNIESGKCINFLVIISSVFLCVSFFCNKIGWLKAIIISIILGLNPVNVSQLFTYYNDGIIYSFILILTLSLLNIIDKNKISKKLDYLIAFICITILINIKFTGFAYAGISTMVFYIFIIFNKELRKLELKKMTLLGIIAVTVGALLIGYSTYVKNFSSYGHPFYPLFGKNKVDIMTENQPQIFKNMNRIKKFIYANFSESNNITAFQDENPTLKIPFTVNEKELSNLYVCDLRIGGFGVFFGGILLLSIPVILVGMYFLLLKDKEKFYRFFIPIITLIILVIVLNDAWWARYLPQLYFIPCIACLILIYFKDNHKVNYILMTLIILLLSLNINYFYQENVKIKLEKFKDMSNSLEKIKNEKNIILSTEYFDGAIYNIYDINNSIIEVSDFGKLVENDECERSYAYNDMIEIYRKKE